MLEIRGLKKYFGGARALDGVDMAVAPGRIHALLGENGAGKSSLLKVLSGVYHPDAGEIRLGGEIYAPQTPRQAEAAGLRFVHQELNLVPGFTAYENAFVGRRYPRRFGLIDWKAMRRRLEIARARIGLDLPLYVPVRHLSIGQCQLVEILRALTDDARILVLDEPTASLSESEAGTLHKAMADLAASGCAVIFVSHRMEEVFEVAQDYTILRNGVTVGAGSLADITPGDVVALMAGEAFTHAPTDKPPARTEAVLELRDFSPGAGRRPISLTAAKSEIVGLYGMVGSGRSSLLQAIWGARAKARGSIVLNGVQLAPAGISARIKAGVAFAPEDRRSAGLALRHSILDNGALPRLSHARVLPGLPILSYRKAGKDVGAMLGRLKVKYGRLADRISTLSGGNQQKVLIGRWISPGVCLYLLDEPTRGVDVRSKAEIHDLSRHLAASGTTVIFATSDIEELFALAGRIVVIAGGAIVLDSPAGSLTRQQVLAQTFSAAAEHDRRIA